MLSEYTIWLCDTRGYRIRPVTDFTQLSYTLADDSVGYFSIALPPYYKNLVTVPDAIFEVWRAPDGRGQKCESVFFTEWRERRYNDGVWQLTYGGPDPNGIPGHGIVAYAAGTSYTSKTDSADDVMKAFMRENFSSSATDTDRDLTNAGLSIEADDGLGVSLTKGATRSNIADVLRSLRDSSIEDGTPIFWRIVPTVFNPLGLTFRTYKTQIGTDRTRTTGGNPLVFDPESGNVNNASIREDWGEEITVVYACGAGIETARLVVELEDTDRSTVSAWRRREAVYDNAQILDSATLTDAGNAVLTAGKPKKRATAQAVSSPGAVYGKDWKLGDTVTLRVDGESFDVRVASVSVDVNGDSESISCRLEYAS